MNSRVVILFLMIGLIALSCSKMNPGDCFKNTGPVTEEERDVSAFNYIHMQNNVDVFVSQEQSYSVTVRAGKNIIPGIKTNISGRTLTISNDNTCNWVRSYESPIEVYLGVPKLDSIVYESSGNLKFLNQYQADSLKLDVLEGAGSIDIWVNTHRSWFSLQYGTADLTVKGYSHINYLYSGGYGPADLRDLNTTFNYVTNNSTNNCFVRSEYTLEVIIPNVGDIYYWGDPPIVTMEITGEGKLYKQ